VPAQPGSYLGDLACLARHFGGSDHRGGPYRQEGVKLRPILLQVIGPDRHGDQVGRIGATIGHSSEVGTEETRAGRWEKGDVKVGGQGSADSRFERFPERGCLRGRQLHDEPPTALQRDAHDYAAPLLGDLQRTIACPRLHRRHPASPSCRGAAGVLT